MVGVGSVSSILMQVMPAVVNVMKEDATLVTLVKPQFEARRSQVNLVLFLVFCFFYFLRLSILHSMHMMLYFLWKRTLIFGAKRSAEE